MLNSSTSDIYYSLLVFSVSSVLIFTTALEASYVHYVSEYENGSLNYEGTWKRLFL
jgi:hypothetical protein